jgi:hypothetical protein
MRIVGSGRVGGLVGSSHSRRRGWSMRTDLLERSRGRSIDERHGCIHQSPELTALFVSLQPTHWKGPVMERIILPRKASFFIVVAAEAASAHKDESSNGIAADLWRVASRLYTLNSNPADGGGDYGWATLRAFCLDSLAVQGNSELSLEAAELLLSLLAELDPEVCQGQDVKLADPDTGRNAPRIESTSTGPESVPMPPAFKDSSISRATIGLEDVDMQEALASASQFAKNIRASYASLTAGSPLLAQQSKWAGEDPIPPICIPLADTSSLSDSLISLKSVWPHMDYEIASQAQRRCLERISKLRRAVATADLRSGSFSHGLGEKSLPIFILSSMAIHSEPHLELECVQKQGSPVQSKQGSMATFFNPFAKKKVSDEPTARVVDGEERAMIVKFGNCLSVPLDIHRSQLVFDDVSERRVKASSVSFLLPSKASNFVVQYPFAVLSNPTFENDEVNSNGDVFDVKGVRLTLLGRSILVPIAQENAADTQHLARSISMHVQRAPRNMNEEGFTSKARIETYPCQPKLQISFADTGAPTDSIPVSLSDGEVFTVPAFRLRNHRGFNSQGKIQCLEISSSSSVGRKLFDSTATETVTASETEFMQDVLFDLNPSPFKVIVVTDGFTVDGVNSSDGHGLLSFQFAAARNFSEKLPNGATIDVVFRYRGPCTMKAEVWRKQVVKFHLSHRQGPRIASISFRPDLIDKGTFVNTINKQWLDSYSNAFSSTAAGEPRTEGAIDSADLTMNRIGMDPSVGACSSKCVFVLVVANAASSAITLRRLNQAAFGFEACPLDEIVVDPGVSAQIPIVEARIARVDNNAAPVDVLAELVHKTIFIWESDSGRTRRRGYVRIPPSCLFDVVQQHPMLVSQICVPPCTINLAVGGEKIADSLLNATLGRAVNLELNVAWETWVPREVQDACIVTMEFQCARQAGVPSRANATLRSEFAWVGKLRHAWDPLDPKAVARHQGKIVFLRPGTFAVSAFVGIARRRYSQSAESTKAAPEIWWAPSSQRIVVGDKDNAPSQ